MALVVCVYAEDTAQPGRFIFLEHWLTARPDRPPGFPWHRWLLDRIHDVEVHEMCEAFRVGDGRPFNPHHGPGVNLYAIRDRGLPQGWQISHAG